VEPDQLPRRSRRLLQLPLHFESFPSKRHRVIKHGTHTSTYHTYDSTRMITELSHQDTGIPSTPTPTIVNGTPSTLSTTMVVVSGEAIIIVSQPIVKNQPIATNSFGSLGHSPRYNVQSIPMDSNPFSYGMPNFTSQFSNSILAAGLNASIGLGGKLLLILHSCLVALMFLKQLLPWDDFLHLILGLILFLLDGVTNLADKLLLKFYPLHSPPQC
jgi:hypothetical protein